MEKHANNFQLAMYAGNAGLLAFSKEGDDYGLYAKGKMFRNSFGTSLLARGTLAEMSALQKGRL